MTDGTRATPVSRSRARRYAGARPACQSCACRTSRLPRRIGAGREPRRRPAEQRETPVAVGILRMRAVQIRIARPVVERVRAHHVDHDSVRFEQTSLEPHVRRCRNARPRSATGSDLRQTRHHRRKRPAASRGHSCPVAISAGGKAPTTSARPPVFKSGYISAATCSTHMVIGSPLAGCGSRVSPNYDCFACPRRVSASCVTSTTPFSVRKKRSASYIGIFADHQPLRAACNPGRSRPASAGNSAPTVTCGNKHCLIDVTERIHPHRR